MTTIAPRMIGLKAPTGRAAAKDREISGRSIFPVGAKFQKLTEAEKAAYFADPAGDGTRGTDVARTLPVGARFPRWTDAEKAAYLAHPVSSDTRRPDVARTLPVGARFPRWTDAEKTAYLTQR